MNGTTAYVLSKKYTKDSLIGVGALKGAPCTVQDITKVDGVTTVTLKWTDSTGTDHTSAFDINDGISITDATVDSDGHLIITFSDGTTKDSGQIVVNATGGGEAARMLTGTLLASAWVANTQTVNVTGLQGAEDGIIGLSNLATEAEIAAARIALITVSSVSGGNITFKCEQTPNVDINFSVLIPGSGGSAGGGSSELEESLTAGITVGGISSGKTYAAGTSYEIILNDLLNPTLYPTFTAPSGSLSGTGSKLLKTGSTLAVTLTATLNRGSISPAYGTSGKRSGEAIDYTLNGGTAQSTNTWSETVSASNKSFQVVIAYAAGEQPKDSKGGNYNSPLVAGSVTTNRVTYDFVMPIYANTSSADTMTELSLISKGTGNKQLEFPATTTTNPECFDLPSDWTLSKIEVLNTLSNKWETATSQFTKTTTTHNDAAGAAVNYNRYTCNYAGSLGARSVKVYWS